MSDSNNDLPENDEIDSVDQDISADDLLAKQKLAEALAQDFSDQGDSEEVVVEEKDPLQVLRAECQTLKEQMLRERADFDNIRKRLRREAEESGARAVGRFVRPILLQLDNFSLALEAAKPEAFMDFAMGVTMIRDGLMAALSDAGISPVDNAGQFDPAHHEVIAEIPNDLPKGHIVTTQRGGYRMGEQLVRAAQVIVSAGPAEAPVESPTDANSDPE